MTRRGQAGLLLAALIAVALFQQRSSPPPAVPSDRDVTATVVRISDGDTLVVAVLSAASDVAHRPGDEIKVRLLRIDTPELGRPGQPLECGAQEATDALRVLTPVGATVTLQYDVEHVDRFGRDLAHVWTSDGVWVNGRMLEDGHARLFTLRPNVAHDGEARRLEAAARSSGRGIWACPG